MYCSEMGHRLTGQSLKFQGFYLSLNWYQFEIQTSSLSPHCFLPQKPLIVKFHSIQNLGHFLLYYVVWSTPSICTVTLFSTFSGEIQHRISVKICKQKTVRTKSSPREIILKQQFNRCILTRINLSYY